MLDLRGQTRPGPDKSEPMPLIADHLDHLRLVTLGQLTSAGAWALQLAHDRPYAVLFWITKGQGVAILDGARRGMGIHNAIFVPPGQLMSLDPGRQGFGQALLIPPSARLPLPETVQHLRIREVTAQTELTALLEAMGREQAAQRPLCQSAMAAHGELVAIWLRRQMTEATQARPPETAARRLVRAYCRRLVRDYANGDSMAGHAAALGVTPTHLTRVCRAETGKTAAALLTERLLHAARQLLVTSDAPIQDIARQLGFGSATYFTRFIQQHTQSAPTALRRSARPTA